MDRTNPREQRAVLVFDSSLSRAETLRQLLESAGYRVYTCGSLQETLTVVLKKRVVVMLLVLGRSNLDPAECIQRLQQAGKKGKTPIILILEHFSEDIVVSALRAGAADYLVQPIDPQQLVRRTGVYARLDEIRTANKESEVAVKEGVDSPSSGKGLIDRIRYGLSDLLESRFSDGDLLDHRYEKVVRLGIGSFGEVWKVKALLNDPPKVFVAKIPINKKLNPKIEKEARILRMLAGHDAVPKVHEVITVMKKSVLIQEFVEGKTLQEVIERELEDNEVESVVIQLVDVVAHAHNLGIIHRDIKPGNVMVKPDGTIKLLDFGAAKELREKSISDTVTGSRPYMAPEQIMGQSQRRSDVWALGVVMYVLYTGIFPFYHEVEKVLMDMILELPADPPSKHRDDIDPEIERIILNCLEKSSEKRYPDAAALKKALSPVFPARENRIVPLF